MSVLDSLDINGFQSYNGIQMLVGVVVFGDVPKVVNISETEVLGLGEVKDGLAFGRCEELYTVVEKLEGVPLARVV